MSYFSSFTQNSSLDANNISSANLSASASFVGIATDTLGVAGLQVSLKTDQNCTVYIEQSHPLATGVGTVTTNGSTTLTGSGTAFTGYRVGDQIYVSGETVRVITTIGSATSLTVTSAFSTSAGGLTFQIYNWDISDSFAYNKLENNFGLTVQAVSCFYRVRVKNLSSSTATTYFRLGSVLCPIVEAVPRALSEDGEFIVDVDGLSDHFGFQGEFTPMRDMKTCEPVRLVGTVFGSSIDTNFWTAINSGTSSASGVANSIATMVSGTSNSGYGHLSTVKFTSFKFAHPLMFRGLFRVTATTATNNTRRWGAYTVSTVTPQNGCYFELSPTGVLSVNTVSAGSVTNTVASGSFNGAVSEFVMDTNVHAYEIIYFTAGIWFYIDNVLIHKIIPTTAIMYGTLNCPIGMTSVNSAGGTTSGTLECWNSSILALGKLNTAPTYKYIAGANAGVALKLSGGMVNQVLFASLGAGAGTIALYDSPTTTANQIGLFGTPASSNTITIDLNTIFYNGLWVVTTGATSNATIIYE